MKIASHNILVPFSDIRGENNSVLKNDSTI